MKAIRSATKGPSFRIASGPDDEPNSPLYY